jgi:hypothetical protein
MADKNERRAAARRRDARPQGHPGRVASRPEPPTDEGYSVPLPPELAELVARDLEEVLGLEVGSAHRTDLGLGWRGAEYVAAVLTRPGPSKERFAAAVVEHLAEVLDPSEFQISPAGPTLSIDGPRGTLLSMPGFGMRLPLPLEDRIRLEFRMCLDAVAAFISEQRGAPWPAPDVEVQVAVETREVRVWWETTRDRQPSVVLRAFDRAPLDI